MKMSISRALKERKRLIGEMNTVRSRINQNNVIQLTVKIKEDGTYNEPSSEDICKHRKLDPAKLMEEWYALRQKLIDLKAKLHVANTGVVEKLAMLSELKAELQVVQSMGTYSSGHEYYGDKFMRIVDVVFDDTYITSKIDELRTKINELQDEIDEYNATHYIEMNG